MQGLKYDTPSVSGAIHPITEIKRLRVKSMHENDS